MTAITTIRLAWSNAHLIIGDRAVLFDAGSPGDERVILDALGSAGIRARDLALIILGHGHADHAGAAAAVREAIPGALAAAQALLAGGARRLHLGHGGPVDATAVAAYLARAAGRAR